jgi:hypothetical protein
VYYDEKKFRYKTIIRIEELNGTEIAEELKKKGYEIQSVIVVENRGLRKPLEDHNLISLCSVGQGSPYRTTVFFPWLTWQARGGLRSPVRLLQWSLHRNILSGYLFQQFNNPPLSKPGK